MNVVEFASCGFRAKPEKGFRCCGKPWPKRLRKGNSESDVRGQRTDDNGQTESKPETETEKTNPESFNPNPKPKISFRIFIPKPPESFNPKTNPESQPESFNPSHNPFR